MGTEINQIHFKQSDYREFWARLLDETKILNGWFRDRDFDHQPGFTAGLELEAYLIDENQMPAPRNKEFLEKLDHEDVVPELAKFNFEVNAPPHAMEGAFFSATLGDIEKTWAACRSAGASLGITPVLIGILPTLPQDMLDVSSMTKAKRYQALNEAIMNIRAREPLSIAIEGRESLEYDCTDIMLEAACTSLQVHLKFNQDDAVRFYNAALIAAAPLIAASGNSPYLYGRCLWEETRIPAFEQAVLTGGIRDAQGGALNRVSLGTGYLRQSFLELFLHNLSFPTLLPALQAESDSLPHLRLQNGTIWRWVRPILGFEDDNRPHLRLEHRIMPAGPSLIDTVANVALCHGLILALGRREQPPEDVIPFEDARNNFYACARYGLGASIRWGGNETTVQSLLLNHLLPAAQDALLEEGVDRDDVRRMFADILVPRLHSGRTGAAWQRGFIAYSEADFQALMERYVALQVSGAPVHEWTL